ncbi:MAG: NAD(P)/FAD-dependent oxidoreductase [bacterium]|nr:NAD(P)/FAD-dependent oxidoreductase [bacterium]
MLDIVIIGGGVVGCAIARELSKYKLNINVVEKNEDVAIGVSKANSGIVHGGYNEKPGTLKADLCTRGNAMFDELSKELDVTFRRNGALVVAFNEDEVETLHRLNKNGAQLGVQGLSILTKEEARKIEPTLSDQIVAALKVPTSGIINPYELTIALGENASMNGVQFLRNSKVTSIEKLEDGTFHVFVNKVTKLHTKVVINAAGLYSDEIAKMLGAQVPDITPVKGEYCLFNKIVGGNVTTTIFQVPTETTKGILVTPTSDGNLLVGPNATLVSDKEDVSTAKRALVKLLSIGDLSIPGTPVSAMLTTFSGLRPKTANEDFIIEEDKNNKGMINLIGIDSPGLTAAPAIAVYVKDMVAKVLPLKERADFNPLRKRIPMFSKMTVEEKNALIKEKPAYGKIICKCELISEGEIIEAIHRPLGAHTVDGIKRRTRATLGGCQGLGCLFPIAKIISRELNVPLNQIMKNEPGSNAIGFKEDK